jgi:hypothetical protein
VWRPRSLISDGGVGIFGRGAVLIVLEVSISGGMR